ncbi:MAG: hypothetical protein ACYTGC_20165 [Planctomycetota bacterium]|jgi:beta-lactamase regulating signal transducer with metallopeptidase domain
MGSIDSLSELLGWVLVHFLWQGAVVAVAVAVTLRLMSRCSASSRYVVACGGLLTMLLAPVITTAFLAAALVPGHAVPVGGVVEAGDGGAILASIMPALAVLWLTGTCYFHARLLLLWGRAERLRRAESEPLPAAWRPVVADLIRRTGVRRPVRVVQSTIVQVPTVIGWLKPVVLVPVTALRTCCSRCASRCCSTTPPCGGCHIESAPSASTAVMTWPSPCAATPWAMPAPSRHSTSGGLPSGSRRSPRLENH